MHKARLTEHQNITIIKLVEAGRAVKDICQEADICEVTDDIIWTLGLTTFCFSLMCSGKEFSSDEQLKREARS
ncbi:hypothetical protein K0838_002969 [Salmonella enterica]|nr:hypothetical protein [Salmonella enterica]